MKQQLGALLRNAYELTSPGTTTRWHSMEGMRGVAVLLVFLVHYHVIIIEPRLQPGLSFHLSTILWGIGHAGVDLFFVLSGYLIYGVVIRQPVQFTSFFVRRARRLYPVFLVVFGLYFTLSFVFPEENKIPPGSLADMILFLVQNLLFLPGLFDIPALITVAWSLSYEVFYYLTLPVIVTVCHLQKRAASTRLIFWAVGYSAYAVYCLLVDSSHVRLLMFGAGIFLYESIHTYDVLHRLTRDYSIPAVLLFCAGLFAFHAFAHPDAIGGITTGSIRSGIFAVGAIFVAFYCFVLVGLTESRLYAMLSWAPLRYLGNMSYSYYLIHGLTLKAVGFVLSKFLPIGIITDMTMWVFMPLAFGITWLMGTVLFLGVEKPLSLAPRMTPSTSAA